MNGIKLMNMYPYLWVACKATAPLPSRCFNCQAYGHIFVPVKLLFAAPTVEKRVIRVTPTTLARTVSYVPSVPKLINHIIIINVLLPRNFSVPQNEYRTQINVVELVGVSLAKYADDILDVSRTQTGLEKNFRVLSEEYEYIGLKLNESKTEFLDYHVVFLHQFGDKCLVYDLDSELPFPTFFPKYVTETFRTDQILDATYHRYFRVVPATVYLTKFSSDRRHMRKTDGSWLKPPPEYPCLQMPVSSADDIFVLLMRWVILFVALNQDRSNPRVRGICLKHKLFGKICAAEDRVVDFVVQSPDFSRYPEGSLPSDFQFMSSRFQKDEDLVVRFQIPRFGLLVVLDYMPFGCLQEIFIGFFQDLTQLFSHGQELIRGSNGIVFSAIAFFLDDVEWASLHSPIKKFKI
ncbi:hypothetical protein QYM36_004616 [Artemia franciscana]|uniref:Protein N-terminal glutamine amidohydrolase n=1 Tax=Artemia franciscana TaxID=6661 RepID=A0AA88IFB5_ARTSF|nr:hypothetical protein QYM36_004616 [Artemia franciscana]